MSVASSGFVAAFAGGIVATMVGSLFYSSCVDFYSSYSNSWYTSTLSIPRSNFAGTTVNNLMLFGGGLNSEGLSDRIDIYNILASTWQTTKLYVARSDVSAVTLDCRALFVGGTVPYAIDIYDSNTNFWTTAVLAAGGFNLAAGVVGSVALFAGGMHEHGDLSSVNYLSFCSGSMHLCAIYVFTVRFYFSRR